MLLVDLLSVQLRCLILAEPTLMVDLRSKRAITRTPGEDGDKSTGLKQSNMQAAAISRDILSS